MCSQLKTCWSLNFSNNNKMSADVGVENMGKAFSKGVNLQ